MSTFERVRKNILRDMASCRVHTSESWAQIILRNTSRLTDVEEQKKFWNFMTNPQDDEDIPKVTEFAPYVHEEKTDEITKCDDMTLENHYHREGATMYVRTEPIQTGSEALDMSLVGQRLLTLDEDEKKEM